MNIEAAASVAMAVSQQKVQNGVQTSMLKKAMDQESQGMAQLLAALPAVGGTPGAVGQTVDISA